MAWSDPRAWPVGEVALRRLLQRYVSGNVNDLKTWRGCIAHRTAVQSINSSSTTAIQLTSEEVDTDSIHDTVTLNHRFTVPSGFEGWAVLGGSAVFATNTTGSRRLLIRKTGTTELDRDEVDITAALTTLHVMTVEPVTGGEWFDFAVFQDSGSALNLTGSREHACWIWLIPSRGIERPATWKPSRTWANDDEVTAPALNAALRDNMRALATECGFVGATAYMAENLEVTGDPGLQSQVIFPDFDTVVTDPHGLIHEDGQFVMPDGADAWEVFGFGRISMDPDNNSPAAGDDIYVGWWKNPNDNPSFNANLAVVQFYLWSSSGQLVGHCPLVSPPLVPGDRLKCGWRWRRQREPSTSGATVLGSRRTQATVIIRPSRDTALSVAFTTPATWASVPAPDEDDFNEQFRDNMTWIHESLGQMLGVSRAAGTGANVTGGTPLTIQLSIPGGSDPDGFWSGANPTRLTVPSGLGGYYLIVAKGQPGGAITDATDAFGLMTVRKNGSTALNSRRQQIPGNSGGSETVLLTIAALSATDYIEVVMDHSQTGAATSSALSLSMLLLGST